MKSVLKDLAAYVGAGSTSVIGVSGMKNFNPFTLSYWATITGLVIFAFFGAILGNLVWSLTKEGLKRYKCHGIGKIHSKA